MVIILCMLTVAAFLIIDYFKISRKKVAANETAHCPVESKPEPERYFHPAHSWAEICASDLVSVGIDDFAQRFIGRVNGVELPPTGAIVRQGGPLATLRRGTKSLTYASPISGTVVEVNPKLKAKPEEVNDSPLERGWLVKLAPMNLQTELHNLFSSVLSGRWQATAQDRLVQLFSPSAAVVMQDGGRLVDNISDLFSDAKWPDVVKEFFPLYELNEHHATESKE
jgi:glycine cleavage system H protein